MTSGYKAGGVVSDTPTGFRAGSVATLVTTRAKLKDSNGADFIVTNGKTFYIGKIVADCSVNCTGVLMYDDDGAGTNEKVIANLPMTDNGGSTADFKCDINCVIPVPSNKYITAKNAAGTYIITIFINGQEI
jgi:hypothetical protein